MIPPVRALLASCLLSSFATTSLAFETEATNAIIMDHDSGIILFEKDARDPMPPASMTKIMTAFLVFEALERGDIDEDTMFTVSEEAWERGGVASGSSTMFLQVGSDVSVIDLLRGVIVQSGNDACIVIAEGLAGSEDAFARRMTERARELGLDSATFQNATGWPNEEHEISAEDLAKLTRMLIERFPERYALYSERSFEWNDIRQSNRNPLLGRFTGADGVKTGATERSGYGLVGSAERDGVRRTIVINGLGSQSERAAAALDIMQAAFRDFEVVTLFESGDVVGAVDVYLGKNPQVDVVLRDTVRLGTERTESDLIRARIDYAPPPAPIESGAKVAELVVTRGNAEVDRFPLYAVDSVARKGFFGRIGAALSQKFSG